MCKRLLVIVISTFGLAACSPQSNDGSAESGSHEGVVGPSTCYQGNKNKAVCVQLKEINGAKEGYLNPYTDPSFMKNANKAQYRTPVQGVDLKVVSPSLQIAPNFQLSEFMSLQKGHFGIFSSAIVKKIQSLRDMIGAALRVNSSFRSPQYNAGINGSAKWSRHQYGDAVDIASTGATLDQIVSFCRQLGATYIDKYVSHVHCDWRNTPVEPEFFGHLQGAHTLSHEEAHRHILTDLKETSEIHVTGNLTAGSVILLTSSVTYKEDNEELYKFWEITAPNGDKRVYEQSEVSLPVQKGVYQIYHEIGANIALQKTFIVN